MTGKQPRRFGRAQAFHPAYLSLFGSVRSNLVLGLRNAKNAKFIAKHRNRQIPRKKRDDPQFRSATGHPVSAITGKSVNPARALGITYSSGESKACPGTCSQNATAMWKLASKCIGYCPPESDRANKPLHPESGGPSQITIRNSDIVDQTGQKANQNLLEPGTNPPC